MDIKLSKEGMSVDKFNELTSESVGWWLEMNKSEFTVALKNDEIREVTFYEKDRVESKLLELQTQIETLQSQLKQAEIDAIEKLVKSIHPVMVSTTNVCTRYLNKLKEQD